MRASLARARTAAAIALAATLCLLTSVDSASAEICNWTGDGANDNWSTAENWLCVGVKRAPRDLDTLSFLDNANRPASVNDMANLIVDGLNIRGVAAGTQAWHITAAGRPENAITLTGSLTAASPVSANNGPSFLVPIMLGDGAAEIRNRADQEAPTPLTIGDVVLNGFTLHVVANAPIVVAGHVSGTPAIIPDQPILAIDLSGFSVLTLNDNSYVGRLILRRAPATPQCTVIANLSRALGVDPRNDVIVSGGTLSLADGVTINAPVVLAQNTAISVPAGASATVSGPISSDSESANAPSKSGGGTLILTNTTSAWEEFVVEDGTLRVGAADVLSSDRIRSLRLSRDQTVATLDLNGFDVSIGGLAGGDGGRVLLGSRTLTVNPTPDTASSYDGSIAGTGNLVKSGDDVLELGGATPNTYTGTTTVQGGTLVLRKRAINGTILGPLVVNGGTVFWRASEQVADRAVVTVNAPGELSFINESLKETIGSLTGNGQVHVSQGTLTVGANNTSSTFAGKFLGSLAEDGPPEAQFRLVKVGTGTLTLTSNNDARGLFVVDAGTLLVDAEVFGRGVLVRGGLFGGTGTIFFRGDTFSTITAAGGAISPGHSPGVLHGDAATIAAGGSLVIELNGATPGTGYDQLALTRGLTLAADAHLVVRRGFEAPKGSTFTIVDLAPGMAVTGTFAELPEGGQLEADRQHFSITYQGGPAHNSIVLTALDDTPPPTYFLSEGATGGFFDEDILIANPNHADAPVTLTFSKENGEQVVATRTVPAQARLTVHVDAIAGLEATAASVQVASDSKQPLVVERSMFWDQSYYAGHTGSSIDKPVRDWFFAEGSQGFFDTFVLVINPNTTPTDVTFTFFRENEPAVVKTMTVGATTRLTLPAGDVPELVNRSFGIAVHATQPIMAERSMYFGNTPTRQWSGGTESAGVTAASTHWFLAEGATGGFFDTFVLLSNPQNTAANVTLQYLLDTGDTVTVPKTIPANTRLTTNIEAEDDVRLHNAAVSTVVTSDQPIIAERSMYWPGAAVPWGEGHNSFGVVDAGTSWGLAEGRIGGPLNFHTYILLANPQTTAANVTVNYLRETGAPVTKTYTVQPTSRFNIDTSEVTELHDESFGAVITVTNNVNIIVERSMYWDSNGFSFSGGTNATGILVPPQ